MVASRVTLAPRSAPISAHAATPGRHSSARGIGPRPKRVYGRPMDMPDSTFARLDAQIEDPLGWRGLALLALVLTVAAMSAGLLIGGA